MTQLDLYDYQLPEELIAQYPAERRDGSRLLVVDRRSGSLTDRYFSDLPDYLRAGDVLVMNDSRVIHARLSGIKQPTGAHIELFLLKEKDTFSGEADVWEVLARPARRLKPGDRVSFGQELSAQVREKSPDGSLIVAFSYEAQGRGFMEVLEKVGNVPLPPYIKREADEDDSVRYQTVYAKEPGSAAAPTAGLHFTEGLLETVRQKGVETRFVTLHVGLGTFRPVQSQVIEEHQMHEEFYQVSEETAAALNLAKAQGRRVICVGTTSVRTLESAAESSDDGGVSIKAGWGSTDLFIYPGGRRFKVTDGLITNFHLPKSTLLMLVSAFYDREGILRAYEHAVRERYRFFSYGDAMLIE